MRLFSSSDRTWKASLTDLNLASAPGSPWFRSGWCFNASRLYALRISSRLVELLAEPRGLVVGRRRGEDLGGGAVRLARLLERNDELLHELLATHDLFFERRDHARAIAELIFERGDLFRVRLGDLPEISEV